MPAAVGGHNPKMDSGHAFGNGEADPGKAPARTWLFEANSPGYSGLWRYHSSKKRMSHSAKCLRCLPFWLLSLLAEGLSPKRKF